MAVDLSRVIQDLTQRASGGLGTNLDAIVDAFLSRGTGESGTNLDAITEAFANRRSTLGTLDAFAGIGGGGGSVPQPRPYRQTREGTGSDAIVGASEGERDMPPDSLGELQARERARRIRWEYSSAEQADG